MRKEVWGVSKVCFTARTRAVVLVASIALLACASPPSLLDQRILVDLSHPYASDTIYWPTEEGFVLERESAGTTDKGYWYSANRFRSAEHGGTHIDAPEHFAQGHWTVDEIPLSHLIGPAIRVDVRLQAEADADYEVMVGDFEAWEVEYGPIPAGAIVLIHTGFERHWPDRESYLGTGEFGVEAVSKLHFPGLAPSAAEWLVSEREIHAVGLDTASIDRGQSMLFETHRILFAADIPAFENLTNLDQLPEKGFIVIALPMKIQGGSGAPLRAVGLVPR
jgi:kynurenine formamidase